jgi:DNA-binding response OmpR family regulator
LLLFQHLGRPVSRAHILSTVWKQSVGIPSRTMDTHMSVLRSKLGLRPDQGYRLTPIYGYGYLFERLDVPVLPDSGARLDAPGTGRGPHATPR